MAIRQCRKCAAQHMLCDLIESEQPGLLKCPNCNTIYPDLTKTWMAGRPLYDIQREL